MINTRTRFAPSPTGFLHVGNIRTAIVNWLYAKKAGGEFMLRLDDTDPIRSKQEFAEQIHIDLRWLGIEWQVFAKQSDRMAEYAKAKQKLLDMGRLYPCYETEEELEVARKMSLSRGLPPIYNRAALQLTDEKRKRLEAEGRKPHYRFKLANKEIFWDDIIRGETRFQGKHLSDPILFREDGSLTYILSSIVDDIDYKITDIIRGEDHVSNTAIQIQIFEALGATPPNFAHLALIRSTDTEISKRTGGFSIKQLREEFDLEPNAIINYLSKIGTSDNITPYASLEDLVESFDLNKFGRAPACYSQEDLLKLNHKLLINSSFSEIKSRLRDKGLTDIDEKFWEAVKTNINVITDLKGWHKICTNPDKAEFSEEDASYLKLAENYLPRGELTEESWDQWIKALKANTNRKGKAIFMPLRLALTGLTSGPELKKILPLIGRDEAIRRLAR